IGDYRVLYTSGDQSENDDFLGMAIAAKKDKFGVGQAPIQGEGITHTELAMLYSTTGTYEFYFMADWERSKTGSGGVAHFKEKVTQMAKELSAQITISKEN
ncbi:MAG: DUF4861 family protein, partial [Bacteroidota bacterium]